MNEIRNKIDNVLKELGYGVVEIDGKELYHNKCRYYRFTYIESFRAYVIEYAN